MTLINDMLQMSVQPIVFSMITFDILSRYAIKNEVAAESFQELARQHAEIASSELEEIRSDHVVY